jgi:hypothetical protein
VLNDSGVDEQVVTGLSSQDNAPLTRALGDRRDSCQTAQGGIVTSLQGIASASRVARTILPTPGKDARISTSYWLFAARFGLLGRDEAGQRVGPLMRLLKLTVDETDARKERGEVCAGGFDRAGGNLQGRPARTSSTWAVSKRQMRLRFCADKEQALNPLALLSRAGICAQR